MTLPTPLELTVALRKSWGPETAYGTRDEWDGDNPARGQCVVSSLVVQDYLGGDIVRYAVFGDGIDENHYYNVLVDGTVFDTTGSQYTQKVSMRENPIDLAKNHFSSVRERCLADDETKAKYILLKRKVELYL